MFTDLSQAPEPDAVSGKVPCGSWRSRYTLATHLSGLAQCLAEGPRPSLDGGQQEVQWEMEPRVAACARLLAQDPVHSVRMEAIRQIESLKALGYQIV